MTQAELPVATVQALSVSWLEGRDLQPLENVDDLAWLWEQIHALGRRRAAAILYRDLDRLGAGTV